MTTAVSAVGIVVAALVATAGYLFNQRLSRNERLARLFADALRPVWEYRGLPFVVRRRQASDATTRRDLAELLSRVHTSLDYYIRLVALEAPGVGEPYRNLVDVLRSEVGQHVKDAWKHPEVTSDEGMNMGLGEQYPTPQTFEAADACLVAMGDELRKLKWR